MFQESFLNEFLKKEIEGLSGVCRLSGVGYVFHDITGGKWYYVSTEPPIYQEILVNHYRDLLASEFKQLLRAILDGPRSKSNVIYKIQHFPSDTAAYVLAKAAILGRIKEREHGELSRLFGSVVVPEVVYFKNGTIIWYMYPDEMIPILTTAPYKEVRDTLAFNGISFRIMPQFSKTQIGALRGVLDK